MYKSEDESCRILRKQLFAVGAAEGSLYSAWKDRRSIGGEPQTLTESVETSFFRKFSCKELT